MDQHIEWDESLGKITKTKVKSIQNQLKYRGIDPGPIDGDPGPRTAAAIIAFKRTVGLWPRAYYGELTDKALFSDGHVPKGDPVRDSDLPWIMEAVKVIGLHEVRDNAKLKAWLASDGHALGDPAKLPWCGDAVETPVRLTLRDEILPGALNKNPYWALNWQLFGVPTSPTFGCVISIKRPQGGHVGFLVGQDATRYYVLGGNQRNEYCVAPMDKSRFTPESFRWPASFPRRPINVPMMTSSEASSVNEA